MKPWKWRTGKPACPDAPTGRLASPPPNRRTDLFALAILSSLLTLLFIDVLIGRNAFYIRDIAFYYYPAKHLLREIVLGGEFPYWNPFLSAGQPLAANPEHEVFYPLTWLILLPSYDLGFRLLVLLHLHICGWTMYALLRSMRTSAPAALIGAFSFALGGLVLSCIPLLPILFVLAWLPLTCLFTRRYLLEGRPRDFAFAAMSLGLQMLAGEPTTIAQTGFLLGAGAVVLGIRDRSVRPLLRVALISLAAMAIAAATILPAIDHARDSVRADGFTFDVVTTWSMPPARLAELVWPQEKSRLPFFLSIYPGLLVTVLALVGLLNVGTGFSPSGGGLKAVTALVFVVSFLLALGHHTPLWQWLYDTGLARSIRYPEKFILMGVFALTVFAIRVLDGVKHRAWLALAAVVVLIDLGARIPRLAPRIRSEYLTEPPPLAQRLPAERESWRLMHVVQWQTEPELRVFESGPDHYWMRRNALRPIMPARWGIRTVMEVDYDLTALKPTEDFVATAWWLAHVRRDWAELVAPMANARFLGSYDDPRRVLKGNRRDVQPVRITPLGDHPRYWFAERMVPVRDLDDFARKLAGARSTRGTAYVMERSGQAGLPVLHHGTVHGVRETANTARIEVETAGPAFLVMSVTPHKYWRITIDGNEAEAVTVNAGFQGVAVPAGRHVVEMRYRNPLVVAGAGISLASLLALAFITMRRL